MASYLIRRFLLMVLTLFGISIVIFVLLRIVPGNIADILFSSAGMINPADKAQIEKELGLDQPIVIQYVAVDRRARCTAISAIPTSPRSRRCRRSCRACRSPPSSPAWRSPSRCCSAFRSA